MWLRSYRSDRRLACPIRRARNRVRSHFFWVWIEIVLIGVRVYPLPLRFDIKVLIALRLRDAIYRKFLNLIHLSLKLLILSDLRGLGSCGYPIQAGRRLESGAQRRLLARPLFLVYQVDPIHYANFWRFISRME